VNNSKTTKQAYPKNFQRTLYPAGRYCKKINGKIYYFGSDKLFNIEISSFSEAEFSDISSFEERSKNYIALILADGLL